MEKNNQMVCAIVAVGPDNVIGIDGRMPWHSKQDFYHFKKLTTENPCIFGKTTFFNMPKHPLSKRPNIVCSSKYNNEFDKQDVYCASSLENALKQCVTYNNVFVCGGVALYKYAFDQDLIDITYLTQIISPALAAEIADNPDKYTRFPFDIKAYFNSSKWVAEKIEYPSGVLPVENPNIMARFFKYIRDRKY